MFEAEEIRAMLQAAGVQLRAMILLAVNCGFGNHDVGTLPLSAIDLDGGWVKYPRPKTEVDRRCPLWPETVAAVREALTHRPTPKASGDQGLVFITKYGKPWAKFAGILRADEKPTAPDNPVSKETRKLLDALGINGHRGFYALRHTFETIGGDARDQVAVDFIMGHAEEQDDMGHRYRERIDDDRLRAVAEHVRRWLWPPSQMKPRLHRMAE